MVMTDGVITAVGPRDRVRIPEGAVIVDGTGLTVTAGFWNTHVHFMERSGGSQRTRGRRWSWLKGCARC